MGAETLPHGWWRDADTLRGEYDKHGSLTAAANFHGNIHARTLIGWWSRHGFRPLPRGPKALVTAPPSPEDCPDDSWLLAAIKRLGDQATVMQIADASDVAPKHVRAAIERLRSAGFRVGESDEKVVLTKVVPAADRSFTASPALFDGDVMRVGVISDTHLGAKEEALDELHCAYDIFEREGIREVWHAGDWGTGLEMFRTHHAESKVHTAPEQVDYLVENYPRRKGIVTRGISGNHDLEGAFGRLGFDPVAAMAAARGDVDYLGEYGAWIELREDTGSWLHLLHGAGGMSYAYSYKAQKLVDGYPAGRKPALLIVGHWHVAACLQARNVKVMFPGCFEWQSRFMQRLGLQPAVGFHILEMTVADDGSIVRYRPEWMPFYGGRKVAA